MAQTKKITRPSAEQVFTNRLYAGMIGSGKSTTIGRDIRTILEADEDYHVIDIMSLPHGRKALDNYRGSFAEVQPRDDTDIDLRGTAEKHPYLRVDAEWLTIGEDREAVKNVFEQALDVAKESDQQVVVVLDDLSPVGLPGIAEYLSKARSYGVAVWAASLFPLGDDRVSPWTGHGKVILHSDMPEDPDLNLSDEERAYVSPSPRGDGATNPVLVGTPGNWEKRRVENIADD